MFLNEGEKENFLIRESFGIKLKKKRKKKKRKRDGAGEWRSSWNVLMNEGEWGRKGELKRGVEIVENMWRRKINKTKRMVGMVEREMEKEKII